MFDLDQPKCDRIRKGDAQTLDELVSRDHTLADLLARAVTGDGGPGDAVAHAWTLLISDIMHGRTTCGLRAALLTRVITVLQDRNQVNESEVTSARHHSFLPPDDDRWAGWWEIEPPIWPAGVKLTADVVLRALHRIPIVPRIILILRDAAKLSAAEVESILQRNEPQQTALLDAAREAYVCAIDDHVITERETK